MFRKKISQKSEILAGIDSLRLQYVHLIFIFALQMLTLFTSSFWKRAEQYYPSLYPILRHLPRRFQNER